MENMDKGLTVPKWVLINCLKIPQNLSVQTVCKSPKVWDFDENRLHWVSAVRGKGNIHGIQTSFIVNRYATNNSFLMMAPYQFSNGCKSQFL